jgi:hypothetical protein
VFLTRRSPPRSTATFLRRILQNLRFQLHHPLMYLIFDLDKGRFGMCSSPLFDVTQDLFTLL